MKWLNSQLKIKLQKGAKKIADVLGARSPALAETTEYDFTTSSVPDGIFNSNNVKGRNDPNNQSPKDKQLESK